MKFDVSSRLFYCVFGSKSTAQHGIETIQIKMERIIIC